MAAPHAQGGSTGQAAKAGASRDEAPLRVILVGRTGLDAKLRLDPAVELVRVKTAPIQFIPYCFEITFQRMFGGCIVSRIRK